ncbi:hypothetical protein [Halarcobacter sp.]|uniref:hypothetical protein n=1 Tax=Halarcobacter sp. TaxID=2321133 RepID=UPI002AA908F3|nr:hypothetical protein [Halarcobacter sp.]
MLLIIEIVLFLFVMYRGWFFESLGLLFLFFIEQILIVELNITNERITFGVELLFIVILISLALYKKRTNVEYCDNCNTPLKDSIYSCNTCGAPLVNEVYKEIKTEASYIIRLIMKNKNSFQEVKEVLANQYKKIGLEDIVIDKDNTFMIKNDKNAYILLRTNNFDLTIETFNVNKPNLDEYRNLFILKPRKRDKL